MNQPADTCAVLLVDDQIIIAEAVRRILATQQGIAFHIARRVRKRPPPPPGSTPPSSCRTWSCQTPTALTSSGSTAPRRPHPLTPLSCSAPKKKAPPRPKPSPGANDYIVKLPDPVEFVARIRYHSRRLPLLLRCNQAFDASASARLPRTNSPRPPTRPVASPEPMHALLSIDWRFVPPPRLGGDCFDYFPIDDDHVALICSMLRPWCRPRTPGRFSHELRPHPASAAPTSKTLPVFLTAPTPPPHVPLTAALFFTICTASSREAPAHSSYTGGGHPPAPPL